MKTMIADIGMGSRLSSVMRVLPASTDAIRPVIYHQQKMIHSAVIHINLNINDFFMKALVLGKVTTKLQYLLQTAKPNLSPMTA